MLKKLNLNGMVAWAIILMVALSGCGASSGESTGPTSPDFPADTYFSLAVTENSHTHAGARLLFLDFQDETPDTSVIQNNIVISPKIATDAITLDGNSTDWNVAQFSTVNGLVQNNYPLSEFIDAVPTEIKIGSAWDENSIYFIVQWVDAGRTESMQLKKWIFDSANWNAKTNVGVTAGANNENVANASHVLAGEESEDRVFMMFPVTDGENNFTDGGLGCAAYCHANLKDDNPFQNYTGIAVVAMYANAINDRADIWHWKSTRTSPGGYADDEYLQYATGSENGRKPDSGAAAYSSNALMVSNPEFMHMSGLGFTGDVLLFAESVPFSGSPVNAQQIPSVISIMPTGSRADVQAQSSYDVATYTWTVEFKRLRNTGNADDRQFVSGTNQAPPAAVAISSGVSANGATLYASNCQGCHGIDGIGDQSAGQWIYPRIQRASGSLIRKAFQDVTDMQDFSASLSEQETEDIAAYLQTMNTFDVTYQLLVAISGAPAGSASLVTSFPIGLDCSADSSPCSDSYIPNSNIELRGSYIAGYKFTWSGVTCNEGSQAGATCTVPMTSAQAVTINYVTTAVSYNLTVNNGPNGAVTSTPAGINCGASASCPASFSETAEVTLSVVPDSGFRLSAWSGDCTGSGACVLTMDNDKTVNVVYEDTPVGGVACTVAGVPPAIPDIGLQQVVTGLTDPVHVTNAGDGSDRLFIVEQAGIVRVVQSGTLQAGSFLDLRDRVNRDYNEMGLLSIVFHPDFVNNGKFYTNYTSSNSLQCILSGYCTIVSEFTIGATAILEDSERIIIDIKQPDTNHNGGQLAFGTDGYLYIGMGDGGGSGDPSANGQDLTTLLGTILRIDVDTQDTGLEYAVPGDNPLWTGIAGARREIWAYGLRNPWRFSFDPANGDLYAGDVGQSAREEIDVIVKAGNYGWNEVEGDICYTPGCVIGDYLPPVITYPHLADGVWNSITGGMVYRGTTITDLCGVYLFGDYVSGDLVGLRLDGGGSVLEEKLLTPSISSLSSFGYDEYFEVYGLARGAGTLYKVTTP